MAKSRTKTSLNKGVNNNRPFNHQKESRSFNRQKGISGYQNNNLSFLENSDNSSNSDDEDVSINKSTINLDGNYYIITNCILNLNFYRSNWY